AHRRERRGDGQRRDECEQRRLHGILLNHSPERSPPASTKARPPPAAAALTSIVFLRRPVRDPSSSYKPFTSTAATPPVNLPPLPRAIVSSDCGCAGTWMRSVNPPLSFCWTTPSGVPTRIVDTGIFAFSAAAAACSGEIRPAVWPPSDRTTTAAGGRCPATEPFTSAPTRTARATASASAVPCGPVWARA